MKRILALRHGKPVSKDEAPSDPLRPLSEEGVSEARALAAVLKARGIRPDRIVCSHAARAVQTAQLVAEGIEGTPQPVVAPQLYAGTARLYQETLAEQPESAACVMLVGHNPAMEELAALLSGRRLELGTCWLADLAADVARWRDVAGAPACVLRAVLTPAAR